MALGVSFTAGYMAANIRLKYQYAALGQRLGLCSDVPCDHFNARMPAIESIIAQSEGKKTYLAIGDSHVEMSELPVICGRQGINAGIGWATLDTFEKHARRLARIAKPDFIIVSLGTNDAVRNRHDEFQRKLAGLVSSLSDWPLILVPIPPSSSIKGAARLNAVIASSSVPQARPLRSVETTDGLHLSTKSYVEWKNTIIDAGMSFACK